MMEESIVETLLPRLLNLQEDVMTLSETDQRALVAHILELVDRPKDESQMEIEQAWFNGREILVVANIHDHRRPEKIDRLERGGHSICHADEAIGN